MPIVYTSNIESGGTLYGDSSLYYYLDEICDAGVDEYTLLDGDNYAEISIGPINAVGVENDPNFGNARIGPVTVAATIPDPPLEVAIEIGPINCIGVESDSNFGATSLGPIDAVGEEDSGAIEFNIGTIVLGPLYSYGYEGILDEATGGAEIGPVGAIGVEGNVNIGFIELGPLSGFGYSSFTDYLIATWPSFTEGLYFNTGEIGVNGTVTLPVWAADGEISQSGVSGTAAFSQWTADGWVGVVGKPELPEWTAAGTVTSPGWVTGSVELPEWTASGTIQTQTIARASVTLPVWTAEGNTGAVAEVTLPVWVASGTVSNPARLSGTATLPRWLGSGTITTGGTVSGAVSLAAWTADGEVLNGGWVTGAATLPAWTAYGHLAGATTETTYAINLSTGAVTQLLLGTFDKLITAHGKLYGLRDGALIRLDGDDDSGTAIAATIRFAPQQFGTYLAKRLDGVVYLNTRENDGVTLTLVQDEVASWTYRTSTDASPGMGTHRIKVGRGITFHSLGLILENRDGGRLDVGGLEISAYPLSRRPR